MNFDLSEEQQLLSDTLKRYLNNEYAIMALDRNATEDAFITSPTADITLSGGGVLVNSTHVGAAES
ncbi:MAG: hypothetical protein HYR50_10915, partial [Candidatus Rokubacteria bacterium]|nr:hypothetical protein [Candidatus Rokubacteria bacterium]